MPFHIRIFRKNEPLPIVKFDLSQEELESRILAPYRSTLPIVVAGQTTLPAVVARIEIIETPHDSTEFGEWTPTLARNGALQWYHSEAGARDVTDSLIITPSTPVLPQKNDAIELLCSRFHSVAVQLRRRHAHRPTLEVSDEYDVQDLLRSLLSLFFDGIRPEEWAPSYAGKSARMEIGRASCRER